VNRIKPLQQIIRLDDYEVAAAVREPIEDE
jgi:protein-arginine kinase activator protein McsA